MSNSTLATKKILTTRMDKGRGGQKIEKIVIHHMAGILTVEQCGAVFKSRDASAHYGIDSNGQIAQYVDEANTAWACGSKYWNQRTVSIELSNSTGAAGGWKVSDKAVAACIKLVTDIAKRNGFKKISFTGTTSGNLIMHKYLASTACPGPYLEKKFQYITDEVNKVLEVKKVEKTYGEILKYTAMTDVNVYEEHSISSKKIGTAHKGTRYSATEWYRDDWCYIPYLKGWVPIKGSKGTYLKQIDTVRYVVTNYTGANGYADHNTKTFVKNVSRGSTITATKWYGGWCYIPYYKVWLAVSCLTEENPGTKLFASMEKIAKVLKSNNMKYTTSNLKSSLAGALSDKKIDCAHYVSFGLQDIGYLPLGQYIWLNNKINGNGASYVKTHTDKFSISYPNKLPENIILKIGDVCGWGYTVNGVAGQHTQVFAGYDSNGKPRWYSAGTSDVNGKSYGPKRKTTYETKKITVLIRLK